jgi:hypothetical protein
MTEYSPAPDPHTSPRFGPGYMRPMRKFFLRMNDDEAARREFARDADNAVVKYGIIDKLPGITVEGHIDTAGLRTLVLPPCPPPPPPGAHKAGLALRAAEGGRASTNVVFFVRANMILWFALTELYWGPYNENVLAPADRIMLKAFRDLTFKAKLMQEPAAILAEHGMALPSGADVRIREQTDTTVHVVLPPQQDLRALSYGALEELVSGWHWHRALGMPGLSDTPSN